MNWKEIKSNKVRVFRFEDEPEVFYLIKIRNNEYMIVHEDGYDMDTGVVEFVNSQQLKDRYGIDDVKKPEFPITGRYWAVGSARNYVITHWMHIDPPK